MESQIENLTIKLKTTNSDIETKTSALRTLERKSVENDYAIETLTEKVSEFERKNGLLSGEESRLLAELSRVQTTANSKSDQVDQLTIEVQTAKDALSEMVERNLSLESNLGTAQQNLAAADNSGRDLEARLENLKDLHEVRLSCSFLSIVHES